MKVVVGISGGVDSAIAAYILKKQGHEVIPVHFDFLSMKEFHDTVIRYFVEEYKKGATPNPCAYCNGKMKFKKLYEAMIEHGADAIATGHYANVGCESGRYFISKSKNEKKDQSYMLYTLSQEILSHLLLPIGDMDKEEVRNIARELSLPMAEQKDSQDICFIEDDIGFDYREFIKEYDFGHDYKEKLARGELKESEILEKSYLKKGEFVDKDGKVLGFHNGIINYTIGQRKGLNIAFGERKFVVAIDTKKNQVVLGDNDDLFTADFKIKNVIFQKYENIECMKNQGKYYAENNNGDGIKEDFDNRKSYLPNVKVRYRHDGTKCEVTDLGDGIYNCHMLEKVRAVTKGQAAVFYDDKGDIVLGGTII